VNIIASKAQVFCYTLMSKNSITGYELLGRPGEGLRALRGREEEGADPHLQERSPHLPRLPPAIRRLRVHVQAPVIHKYGRQSVPIP
jgi:hypothetical protein